MVLYLRATGKNPVALEELDKEAKYETVTVIPAGIPVLLAVLFLMVLAVVFFSAFFGS